MKEFHLFILILHRLVYFANLLSLYRIGYLFTSNLRSDYTTLLPVLYLKNQCKHARKKKTNTNHTISLLCAHVSCGNNTNFTKSV